MGSIQCALLGFGIFQLPWRRIGLGSSRPFNPLENVAVQTIGVATATMPLAGGFIGIIPALGARLIRRPDTSSLSGMDILR